eukprot:scaffold128892_cov62-Phaeocystis_antarctica.AAC.1
MRLGCAHRQHADASQEGCTVAVFEVILCVLGCECESVYVLVRWLVAGNPQLPPQTSPERRRHQAKPSMSPEYPNAASTSYILSVNAVGVVLIVAVLLLGRMRRSSRAEETRYYTPG